MSQENIELCRRCIAALDARELSDELGEELLAAHACIENAGTAVTDRTYLGAQGAREWIADVFEGLDESSHFEIEEVLADGAGSVVARVRLVGHGARSGAPVMLRWLYVFWLRDGRIDRAVGYMHSREALEAARPAG